MVTIMYFSPFILIDNRCQAAVGDKIVWKCSHLFDLLKNPDIIMDEKEYRPRKIGNEFVALGGWEFNISSTIYAKATPEEVIKGWNIFNDDMGRDIMDRLVQPFFYRDVEDANNYPISELRNHEPEMIELLRLSYWYYKNSIIAKNNTFPSKRKEIRGKLTRDLVRNVEAYKTTVQGEDFIDNMEEFRKKMRDGLIDAKKGKPQEAKFKEFMQEIPNAFWAITSELIFAGISSDAGYSIHFDIPGQGHDYDFIVNDIPGQVKTVILNQKNQQEVAQKIDNRKNGLFNGRKIDEEEVKKEIHNLLNENKGDIKKAIQQGGRVIFFNGTRTYAGFLLNQYASDNDTNLTINNPLQSSINLLKEENPVSLFRDERKFLPLIFGAAGIDQEYRFSTWSFKVPVNLTLDCSRSTFVNRI